MEMIETSWRNWCTFKAHIKKISIKKLKIGVFQAFKMLPTKFYENHNFNNFEKKIGINKIDY